MANSKVKRLVASTVAVGLLLAASLGLRVFSGSRAIQQVNVSAITERQRLTAAEAALGLQLPAGTRVEHGAIMRGKDNQLLLRLRLPDELVSTWADSPPERFVLSVYDPAEMEFYKKRFAWTWAAPEDVVQSWSDSEGRMLVLLRAGDGYDIVCRVMEVYRRLPQRAFEVFGESR